MATRSTPKPARKPAQKATSRAPSAKKPQGLALSPTETPGVFRNGSGILVDKRGIMLSLLDAKRADAVDTQAVIGEAADTPAKFLKAVALDPRAPLATRMEAAKAAAPYTDRKQPQGLDGGVGPNGEVLPISLELGLPAEVMTQLSDTELAAFDKVLELLKKYGLLAAPKEGS